MTTADPLPTIKRHPNRPFVAYEEYLKLADESRIVEWVDGEVISYIPLLLSHQTIIDFIADLVKIFARQFNLGKTILAPFEVKLWPGGPSREPDLIFIGTVQLPQLDERRFSGAPDLVVEVVSAGSVREDKVRKFTEYEQAGVREYWIIDPRVHHHTAEFYRLNEEGILDAVELTEGGRFYSQVLPRFWLQIEWLWEIPLPKVEAALADIFESDPAFPPELGRLYRGLADRLQS